MWAIGNIHYYYRFHYLSALPLECSESTCNMNVVLSRNSNEFMWTFQLNYLHLKHSKNLYNYRVLKTHQALIICSPSNNNNNIKATYFSARKQSCCASRLVNLLVCFPVSFAQLTHIYLGLCMCRFVCVCDDTVTSVVERPRQSGQHKLLFAAARDFNGYFCCYCYFVVITVVIVVVTAVG